jgi:1,4-alpha-glucan branching enzyme
MPPSQRPFLGATPYQDPAGNGVTFRVWTLFANSVCVAGGFNGWSTTANPLYSEGNGFWSVDVPGATTGQQYLFVLQNPAMAAPLWRMDPYAREVIASGMPANPWNATIGSNTEALAEVPGYSTPHWNELVIYEINVRTFLSDPAIQALDASGQHTGSFNSIVTKLDYLRDLGINAIEIMPIFQFDIPVDAGYNYAYMFAIESAFGGPDGFRSFVSQAHQRGIAVIVDVVYNHLGADAGDMWQFDGWAAAPNYGGIYFYNDWRHQTAWGDRLDYGRGEVRQYICDNALRWLEQRCADGLRWDSVGSIRNVYDSNNDPAHDLPDGWSLCQWINGLIQQRDGWKISIAEDLKDNEWITTSAGAGGAGFNAQWGINFFWKLHNAMVAPNDNGRSMSDVAFAIGQTYNSDAFQRVIYTESHDGVDGSANPPMARVPEMIWPAHADSWASKKRSTLGAAALLTSPGIPMLFMGQEFLAWGAWDANHMMDWSHAWQFAGITQLYRDLIHSRRDWFNQTRGLRAQNTNIFKVDDTSKLIAYHRWDQGGAGDDVVVVLNFANQGYTNYYLGLPRAGLWKVRFNSDWIGYDGYFGNWLSYDTEASGPGADSLPFSANIGIGPYTAIILSQDA